MDNRTMEDLDITMYTMS